MKRYLWLGFLLCGLAIAPLWGNSAAIAQSAYDPDSDPYPSGERDTFTGAGDDGLDPFELLHRMRLSPGRSMEEFSSDQQESLDAASDDFRSRQRELLRQPPAASPPPAADAE